MRILAACEESQEVTVAFRRLGHEAYSCDLLPCSGSHPEWHVRTDALELAKIDWDMVIAFPPCTDLAASGARWFDGKRRDGSQQRSIGFFLAFTALDHVPRVAIENPVGIMSTEYRKPDQIIQPWMFGHPESKATCLWLKGLPPLVPTDDVRAEAMALPEEERCQTGRCCAAGHTGASPARWPSSGQGLALTEAGMRRERGQLRAVDLGLYAGQVMAF